MASQLSDEEFQRLQTQLIELRTANYGLEEQCKKYRSDNEALSSKLGALEREYQRVQKSISRSRKAKDIDLLVNENENLQAKLEAQEEDFRLQNQTLLQELSTLIAENEKFQQELTVIRAVDDAASPEGNVMGMEKEGHPLQAEITVNTKLLGAEHKKAKRKVGEQNETTQVVSTADIQKNETVAGQDDSVPSSEGDFVQVDEIGENQRPGSPRTDFSKHSEQKLQGLEAYQRNLADVVMQLEAEQEERKQLESEVKQLQEKLHRKQESFCQLQEEKERLYTENRRAYEKLQLEKEHEVGILKEQSQRLQVQLNNSQLSLQDLKRKSSQQIQELESHISLLTRKNESVSEERLLELRAKVIELECVLGETREKLGHVQQQNSDLESHLADTKEKLNQKQTLVSGLEEEKTQLTSALDEVSLLAEKRKKLVDEMSIRIQQKSDEYKLQFSNLTDDFNSREQELQKQVKALQEEVEKLAPLQGQLDDALVQVKSLEATRGWLERCHKEAENKTESTRTYYESVIGCLKAEHSEEVHQLKLSYDNQEKALQEELESVQRDIEKKDEALNRLEQQLRDAEVEKQLAGKKGAAVMKDLQRQLASERKRAEKLQDRIRDLLNEGTHISTDVTKSHDPETSSVSSWSMMSGNCEPRETSTGTRENSIVAGSISNLNGNISPSPEDQDLEQENYRLLSRITALQQEKWVLEEKINHLEQGSAAMAEDLMCKTALIQYYFTERRSDQAATSSSSPTSSSPPSPLPPPPSSEKLSVKKFLEMLKGPEHVHESNRRMQRMLEEVLTKNMHLQNNLDQLSLEVVRLSKGPDNSACS